MTDDYTLAPPYPEAIPALRRRASHIFPDDKWTMKTLLWADGTYLAAAFHTKPLESDGIIKRQTLHYDTGKIVKRQYKIRSQEEILDRIPICDPRP